ncbi:MAG: TlpA disulfide reductase family protein [Candidatus Rokubacteria bacterium]|nr:TlpA disulfide reductase family protein [Candidatus Rokubacteria bacterium]
MTPSRPAAMDAWPPAWLAARLLAFGLLVAGLAGAASADQPALAPLLKTLDLRGYTSRTAPPQFSGSTLDARQLSMTEYRGTVIVLTFWASWCLECRVDMPALERLQREFSPRGFAIIAVNARENKETVRRYAKELGLTFPLVFDPDGKINALYGVIGLPTTFVVGRDGRAIAFAIGPRRWESAPARALIEALLAEPVPGPATQ